MKKLLLLSALLIFACSSDDSNENDQLFLNKYNGVVWEDIESDPSSDYKYGHIFYSSPPSVKTYDQFIGEIYCDHSIFGEPDQFWGISTTIVSQSEDVLTLEITEEADEADEDTVTYILTASVVNNGETLIIERSYEPSGDEEYNKINSNPCQ